MKRSEHDRMMSEPAESRQKSGEMKHGEPGEMMREHHKMSLWVHPVIVVLGGWLIASPFALGYRSAPMLWSDVISGVLAIGLAVLSFYSGRQWPSWANTFVGLWLLFAPLVFWTPDAAAYANDTLVGALLITFAVLIPHGMPMSGPDLPPGWSYNPSTWIQRAPIIALALISFFMSRYMAAYQLGHINSAWDPFFGDGTARILTSEVSRAWPVSDAGLGAVAYMLEVLMGFMGDSRRWRTMPWMVTLFGILVIPLGITSVVLVILQPVAVGTWCTLCLASAAAMLVMVALTVDEVVAMGQFLAQSHREEKSLWRTFWLGGNLDGGAEDKRSPSIDAPPSQTIPAMFWGVSVPWHLVVSVVVGIWLMFAPSVFGTQGVAADSDHLVGALIVTFAVIAMGEVARAARFVNMLSGAWLIFAPWLLSGFVAGARWSDIAVGVLLILLSLPRGRVRESYGRWRAYIV